eukprot:jgi/Mesen1/4619/ME000237S03655
MGSLAWIALHVALYAVALLLGILCVRQVVARYPNLGYRVRCCIYRPRTFITIEGEKMTVRQALLNAKQFSSRYLTMMSAHLCNVMVGPLWSYGEEGQGCPICLTALSWPQVSGDERISLLPICGHLFHAVCINGFQSVCSACPTCHAIDYAPFPQVSATYNPNTFIVRNALRVYQGAGPEKAGCTPEQAACPSEQQAACPSEQPASCPSEQPAACPLVIRIHVAKAALSK